MGFLPASVLIGIATGFGRDQCFWRAWTTFQTRPDPGRSQPQHSRPRFSDACRREV